MLDFPNEIRRRLSLGKVMITQAASIAMKDAKKNGIRLLARHLHGDWGDISEKDALQNELAILLGLRVQSKYRLSTGQIIWVTSEANRAITTISLADCISSNS